MQGNQGRDTEAGALEGINRLEPSSRWHFLRRPNHVRASVQHGSRRLPLSRTGVQLTDSAYVVASMRIMTRLGTPVLQALGDGDFVKCSLCGRTLYWAR